MKLFILLFATVVLVFASLDINSATPQELQSIKGIGVKKAKAIVAYRKDHCFKSVEEIVKVKGIGKKFLQVHRSELEAKKCVR